MRENTVPLPPSGLAIAVQYWSGDEEQAMRLARLLADIEPGRREDVTLVLARRKDTEKTPEAWRTSVYCGQKFRVKFTQSQRNGTGHPDGCYALWAGTMDQLADAYYRGEAQFDSAFLVESDGVPLAANWIDRLRAELRLAMHAGRRALGAVVDRDVRHVNGTLMAHLSMWRDRGSLHETPAGQAWDLFHGPVLLQETHATPLIIDPYGTTAWSPEVLRQFGKQSCWLASVKDESAIAWAERELVAR